MPYVLLCNWRPLFIYCINLLQCPLYPRFDFFLSISALQYECESKFEGGGWALVRRVKQGSTWHPATDNLAGTEYYGTAGSSTSDSTFSLPFASLITSDQTQFLFASGELL